MAELKSIVGIGHVTASNVISWREGGKLSCRKDLGNVPGVGKAREEKLGHHLIFEDDYPL